MAREDLALMGLIAFLRKYAFDCCIIPRLCSEAPADQRTASGDVNRMIAAAINADAKWFWHGPDA